MQNRVVSLVIGVFLLTACRPADLPLSTTLIPSPAPTATPPPPPTFTPTSTSTPTATATATPDPVMRTLKSVISSEYWEKLGLYEEQMANWKAFAAGEAKLADHEFLILQDFLAQWEKWAQWTASARIPAYEKFSFRVKDSKDAQGEQKLTLYAIDEIATSKEGRERIYLAIPERVAIYKPRAIILAPRILGLRQHISEDGKAVNYIDDQDVPLLKVSAYRLKNEIFQAFVKRRYSGSYVKVDLYPRFNYFIPGVEAGFYLLDKNLDLNQIIFLKETLDLFNTPELEPLIPYFFSEKRTYVVVGNIEGITNIDAIGLASSGIAVLDREFLFEDKNQLAATIAHEASHNMGLEKCYGEVGDGTIPEEFNEWSADELVAAIKDRQIGAVHVSLWMHVKLKSASEKINYYKEVIETGGQFNWEYCSPSGTNLAHVTIYNSLNKPLTIQLRGPTPRTITIAAGSSVVIVIQPGSYEYTITVVNNQVSGEIIFEEGISRWQLFK